MMNEKERLRQTMRELKDYFETEFSFGEQKKELSGEYFMLLSFLSYNDLERMIYWQKKALSAAVETVLLEGAGGSFTYGSPSVLHMFYREPGTADEPGSPYAREQRSVSQAYRQERLWIDYILEAELSTTAEILTERRFCLTKHFI